MKYNEIMRVLSDVQVLKIVMSIDPFYLKFVKKFSTNLPKWFNDARNSVYRKVHVQGNCFGFTYAIINDDIGKGKLIIVDRFIPLKTTAQEIA